LEEIIKQFLDATDKRCWKPDLGLAKDFPAGGYSGYSTTTNQVNASKVRAGIGRLRLGMEIIIT